MLFYVLREELAIRMLFYVLGEELAIRMLFYVLGGRATPVYMLAAWLLMVKSQVASCLLFIN